MLFIYLGCVRNRHFLGLKYCTVTSNCLCLSVCQTGTFSFLLFSVCHAVYWKLKVCMGANNRNSWQEAPEASHKSKGKFDVIASLKLNPAQTEYLAAALCTTLYSHALWYEGGMKVRIGTRLYSVQCLEAHARERQQTMSGMFSHNRNGLCNEESCHVVVLWCITNIR